MALINLKTRCPACKAKFSTAVLSKPPVKRYEGTQDAGACPECKAKLSWFHDASRAMKHYPLMWVALNVGMFFSAGVSIATLVGTGIGVAVAARYLALNQIKVQQA